jgi:NAD dependent epimerase/dehydratase family enzyme
VNLVAPNPVPNEEFARTLARVLSRPALAHVPAVAVELLFGEMGREILLASQRVHPRRLMAAGFEFGCPTLEQALRSELGKDGGR